MAIEIAIDTNRYRDFADGVPEVVHLFRISQKIYVPFIVVAELRAGFLLGTRGRENQHVFEHFLHRPRVDVLLPTVDTTNHYGALFRQLLVEGTPIPTNDLWIAALVIQRGLSLFSRDAHFDVIPNLSRITV